MPITITVSDGTTTATVISIPDNRANITAAALSAAVGDTDPPANNVNAIRRAVGLWLGTTRRQHRQANLTRNAAAALETSLATIASDEATAAP
jgi:hypothetical protein